MLPTNVGILTPVSIGGGQYTFSLFFQTASQPKFLNIGDYVRDSASNEYSIVALSSSPFSNGGTVTVQFVTSDTLPVGDSGFDSTAFTPGQVDVRPPMLTAVFTTAAAISDPQAYEYDVQVSVVNLLEANKAAVGDSFVDLQGKEYVLSFIDPIDRFNVPFKVVERYKEGITPSNGDGAFYRATTNYDLFQGTEIIDPARTVIRNRDNFNIDAALLDIQNQIGSSNAGVSSTLENNTGATIIKATPVCVDSLGDISTIDVSVENEATATIGVTSQDITDGNSGTIVTAGKVVDITTAASFDDTVYVSKSGTLTNVKPDIGVSGFAEGDFVISLGVISKNESNPALKDLIVNVQVIGQL
jgi:hypothetical protein